MTDSGTSFLCHLSAAEEDVEQFSDDEIYQVIGHDLDLNEEERAEFAAFVNNHDSDSDTGDEPAIWMDR